MSSPRGDFSAFARKMEAADASPAVINAFRRSYDLFISGETGQIPEATIDPVAELPKLEPRAVLPGRAHELVGQTCFMKLNGGLGTSMGLERAKSLLAVKDGLTFLDLTCRQVLRERELYGEVAFLLMNSFNTSADCRAFVEGHYPQLGSWEEIEVMQNKVPKVDAATRAPATAAVPELEWCPPGHGDLYAALAGSGKLDMLLGRGMRYLFVSNIDNLGATLDLSLLDQFAASGAPILMEVTERTAADRKGGHLCRDRASGRLRLRELAQCPKAELEPFQDIKRHRFFNTNNLWLDLRQLRGALRANHGSMPLPVIFNAKTVDPRDPKSTRTIQLETAMGAAIEAFDNAMAVVVPRTRFLPVKTTNDLLGLRSDAYTLNADSELRLATQVPPLVDLDPEYYRLIDAFDAKLALGVPSLKACRSLKVTGAVTFSDRIIFGGEVAVENRTGAEQALPPGRYADRKVVIGE